MGAGASSAGTVKKIKELQSMEPGNAVAVLEAAGVERSDAETVVRRLQRVEGSSSAVDSATVRMLVKGLQPSTQEALVALIMPSERRPRNGKLPIAEMFTEMLDDSAGPGGDQADDMCNMATMNFPTYPPPVPQEPSPPRRQASEPARSSSPAAAERQPETIGVQSWKLGKLIGAGSYGQVFQGLDLETGALIAIKTLLLPVPHDDDMEPSDSLKKHLEETHREIAILSTLRHENIVKYLGSEINERDLKMHIFQEWVPGGTLSANIQNFGGAFDDKITRRYLRHILNGLSFLHGQRVVHRDIKGENVLISDTGIAKLADFGASKRLGEEGTLMQTGSLRGTPFFMAPEQMTGKAVGRKCDVWAIGGLALLCATGDPPWKKKNFKTPYALMIAVCRSEEGPPVDGYDLSPDLLDLIERCFTRDADRRPSADDVLRHPFLAPRPSSSSSQFASEAPPSASSTLALSDAAAPAPLPPTPEKTKTTVFQRLKARLSSP